MGQHDQQQPRFQLGPPEIQIDPDPIDMQPQTSPNNHLYDQLRLRRGSQLSQLSQHRILPSPQVMQGQDIQEHRKQDPLDRFDQQRPHQLDIQQHRRRLSAQEDIQIISQQPRRLSFDHRVSLDQGNFDFGHHRLQLGPSDFHVEYDSNTLQIERTKDDKNNTEDKTYEDVLELKLEDNNHHRLKINHPLEKVKFFLFDI